MSVEIRLAERQAKKSPALQEILMIQHLEMEAYWFGSELESH